MVGPGGVINPRGYNQATAAMAKNSAMWRSAVNSTGMFEAGQIRLNSATNEYTRLLEKQKLSFRDLFKNQATARAAYNEQLRLQQMIVRQMPGVTHGNKSMYDFAIPDKVHKSWDTLGNKIGFAREQLRSASTQLINWGKNTQWAGRQLMVGLTLPIAAFGAASAKFAYDIDKQLTRVQKVYNTTANQVSASAGQMMQVQHELDNVRAQGLATAMNAAKQYGALAKDTLDVQAELAATGLKGSELQAATTQVMRAATLGEMDYNEALQATIALQATFHMNSQQLTKTWDYMNSIENATSLQMEDFAKAIPIAAGPVKAFGGDIKELGLLLTAMKERGVSATQGANAIKAALQRLSRPSKTVQKEWKALTSTDITQLVDGSKSLTEIFTKINDVTKNMSDANRRKAFAGLFGTYQVTRMTDLVEGMDDLEHGVGQVTEAAKVGEQGWKSWSNVAQREVKRQADSASGQFKRAIATIQLDLAEMGKPFLEAGATVLKVISTLIQRFNDLPKGIKNFAAGAAILTALVGPTIMLIGLFANFTGNIMKFGVALTGLFTKFELLNGESAAAKVAQKMAASGFITTGDAVSQLALQIQKLTEAQQLANAETMGLAKTEMSTAQVLEAQAVAAEKNAASWREMVAARQAAGMPITAAMLRGKEESFTTAVGYRAVANEAGAKEAQAKATAAESEAKATEKQSRSMKGLAASGAVFAGAMAASMISSNKTVDNISNIAMMTALIGPALIPAIGGMIKLAQIIKVNMQIAGAIGLMSLKNLIAEGNVLKGAFAASKAGLLGMLTPTTALVAGIAAVAASAYLIHKHMQESADAVKNMTSNAAPIGKILGYTPAEEPAVKALQQQRSNSQSDVVKMRDAYPELIKRIQQAKTEQDKFNEALRIGMTVIDSGGTVEQAKQAVTLALQAADGMAKGKQIAIHFKAQMDFNSADIIRQAARTTSGLDITSALNKAGGRNNWTEMLNPFKFGNPFKVDGETENYIKDAAKKAMTTFNAGMAAGQGASPLVSQVDEQLKQIDARIAKSSGDQKKYLGEVRKEYVKQVAETLGGKGAVDHYATSWFKTADALNIINAAQIDYNKEARIGFLLDKQRAGTATPDELKRLKALQGQVADQKKHNNAMRITNTLLNAGSSAAKKLRDPLADTARLAANAAANSRGIAPGLGAAAAQAQRLKTAMGQWNDMIKNGTFGTTLRGAMSTTQDQLGDIASANFDNRMSKATTAFANAQNARMTALQNSQQRASDALSARQSRASDALDRRQENASVAFDNHWAKRMDRVNAYYDNRIAKVNKAIKAEQKAEEIRQRIFDAEMTRIQRLNEAYNKSIDFNVALNTGSLDEAAKIRNDMAATEAQYALGDASKAGQTKSDAVVERLNNRIDAINKAKDARIKALQKEEDAEKRSMARRQDREKKALAASQQRQQKALDTHQKAQQASLQKEIDNNIAANQEMWQDRKDKLDAAITLFKNYVPKNEADLKRHIAAVSKQYSDFNVATKGNFNKTSVIVGAMLKDNIRQAVNSLKDDVAWASMGGKVARETIMGAFGMKPGQFRNWMIGGKWPSNATPGSGKGNNKPAGPTPHNAPTTRGKQIDQGAHVGGYIGHDAGSPKRPNAPFRSNELTVKAEKGEYMFDKHRVKELGVENLRKLHRGQTQLGNDKKRGVMGGAGSLDSAGMGLAGLMLAGLARGLKSTVGNAVKRGGAQAQARDTARIAQMAVSGMFNPGRPGDYAGYHMDGTQFKNASIIANVGKGMGMSARDIEIAFMTAIVESNMRNLPYGDGSSIGMFQQIDSWGSYESRINPRSSSKMFFNALKKIGNRGDMTMGQAAQAVQRSAFPGRYAEHQAQAIAIYRALGHIGSSGLAGKGFVAGSGGRHRPVNIGSPGGIHDAYTGYPAVDIPVPVGTPVFAVGDGRITRSYDIRGYEPRNGSHQNGYRSYGRVIYESLDSGGEVLYAHLSKRNVAAKQAVRGGSIIGRSGSTGHSTGPHLHFGARGVSPYKFLKEGAANIKWDNTLANLHHGEAVLTEDLNKKFKQGVENFANGGNNTYNVPITVLEPGASAEEIAAVVVKSLKREEGRKPTDR